MPKNKNALRRYQLIMKLLNSGNRKTSSEIRAYCNNYLEYNISLRQIQDDLRHLQNIYHVELDYKRPYYSAKKGSLNYFSSIELTEEETNAMLFYGNIYNLYENLSISVDIKKAINKVFDTLNIKNEYIELFTDKPLVLTERTMKLKGNEHLPILIKALKEQKKIKFIYHKFNTPPKERTLSPYVLKEANHLWYTTGLLESRNKIITFAIDRMSRIEILDETITETEFDPDEYFRYSFGITVPEEEPVEVILSFNATQSKYIKALPIHETQKTIIDNEEELRISIKIRPSSFEFYSKILGYGTKVKVISPPFVINELKKTLQETLKQY